MTWCEYCGKYTGQTTMSINGKVNLCRECMIAKPIIEIWENKVLKNRTMNSLDDLEWNDLIKLVLITLGIEPEGI